MKITGTIVHEELEGGFWGIVGDDDQKYRPVDALPSPLRLEGCRVEAEIEPVPGLSFAMWGRNVRVLTLKRL